MLLLLLAVVNLPWAHSSVQDWRLDRSGTVVEADVVASGTDDGRYAVDFVLDREVDPDQQRRSALVTREAYEQAVGTGTVRVQVLPDDPDVHEVRGQAGSSLGLVVAVVADVAILGLALLMWRRRRRQSLPGRLHLVALADVERCRPGSALEQVDETTFDVTGEVCHRDDTGLELDVGDRTVRVDLDGHHNPVGYQQPGRVRGRLADLSDSGA